MKRSCVLMSTLGSTLHTCAVNLAAPVMAKCTPTLPLSLVSVSLQVLQLTICLCTVLWMWKHAEGRVGFSFLSL